MKKVKLIIIYFSFMGNFRCTNLTGDGENEIYQRILNIDKTQTIIKFDRDCGATVGNSVHVSVMYASDSVNNESGNIFIAGMKGSWDESDTTVVISWIDNNSILIKYDKNLTVFKKDSMINDTNVIYQVK